MKNKIRGCVFLAVLLLVSVGMVSAVCCTDSDGGINYNTKGTTKSGLLTKTDSCNGKVLTEYYCGWNNYVQSNSYTCANGCLNGACQPKPVCGNGIKEGAETCDLGSQNGLKCIPQYGNHTFYCKYCTTFCNYWFIYGGECGDGTLDTPNEQCDDGNKINGDGCNATCKYECTENWQCSDYGACVTSDDYCYISSTKYRNCTDLNNCGTTRNKPYTAAACDCSAPLVEYCDTVNIGDLTSETTHNLQNWGPIEPATNGGSWGQNSCTALPCKDGNCRVISTITTGDSASLDMNFGCDQTNSKCKCMSGNMEITALSGLSLNDDFDVYVGADKIYSYDDVGNRNSGCSTVEQWTGRNPYYGDKFGTQTVTFKSTGGLWDMYNTYGKVAVTEVKVCHQEKEVTCN